MTLEMESEDLKAPLLLLPPVDFCCAYGSAILPNNHDKEKTMVDYILGVADPFQWHSENLEKNGHHYSSCMVYLGPKMVTLAADKIGVGVHFNPFVEMNEKQMIKYGVVRMHDLIQDILNWERFYLSGRLQKPVHFLVDNLDVAALNSVNKKAAISAALLLSPRELAEEDLYCKICSLSYTGDLRMLFAEDKNKVKNIVQGHFDSFREMYKPFIDEFCAKGLLEFSRGDNKAAVTQDFSLSSISSLVDSLPERLRSIIGKQLGEKQKLSKSGRAINHIIIDSREEAAKSMQRVLRRTVMVSSARQAISGFLAVGGASALRYLGNKMSKAWRSQA